MQHILSDGFTSLRWYDPDQVQRVVRKRTLSLKTPLVIVLIVRIFNIKHKSSIIDGKLKKSSIHLYENIYGRPYINRSFYVLGGSLCHGSKNDKSLL